VKADSAPAQTTVSSSAGRPLVGELFSAMAQRQPDAIALASPSLTLTYRELELRSNQLANFLRAVGVEPEMPVGICLERSPEMVVAALAVLKAGGAYLPLEPEYPAERLRFMLEDARTPVLITRDEGSRNLQGGTWQTVDLSKDMAKIASAPSSFPHPTAGEDNLAYLIYTSGSTGQPKGVQVMHKSLLNLISWHQRTFEVGPYTRGSQLASVAFDAVVWELWPALTAGASVHFPDEATRVSPEPLRDWLVAERITVSFVPTPLAELLLGLQWPEKTSLRFLLTGGDVLRRYPSTDLPFVLVNNYGPTECTVVTTSGIVSPESDTNGPPAIGYPIDNFRVYILDEELKEVPAGASGELYVGGVGLARGYVRSELDAGNFIENPFSTERRDRLYKTGDLARRLPSGDIAFGGRIDEQIKIRGYRIEPNEIITCLNRYPGVESSAVVARTDKDEPERLVAYLVVDGIQRPDYRELQSFVKEHLPEHMVPSLFVRVDSLPFTSNGKVDRAALPAPSAENILGDSARVAPSTPVEKRVVEILAELLGVDQVSVNDNFFLLGGHSLLGTQLIARARDSFGVELPLRTIFDLPTAAEISLEIERALRRNGTSAE
jgi:amino acid adenylation domain-containing protein